MLRKLMFLHNRQYYKFLSTVPLENIEKTIPTDVNLEILKEKQKMVLQHPDYFNVHDLFTIKDLFDAKVHYGHKITSLNDKMKPFLFGSRLGHLIFDLDITAFHLREALNFIAHIAYRDGIILFISRNPRLTLHVENTALACKEFAYAREWDLGVLTNNNIKFRNVTRLPDLCILLNTTEENGSEHAAVSECARMCIPTVGIVDTNCDPNLITYPVPGNDDSFSAISFYCKVFKEAILRGKDKRKEHEKEILQNSESTKTTENSEEMKKENS